MNKLPITRTKNIVMQDLGNEIMLYDLTINKAFCLNETASIIFRNCDGSTNFNELKLKNKDLSDEIILLALDLLKRENLLVNTDYQPFPDAFSRREAIRKAVFTGLIALPLISTLIAPEASRAQSGGCANQPCSFNNFTQSDCCNSNYRCSDSIIPAFCVACLESNSRFAFAAPFADTAFCNTLGSKNLCCNSGSAVGDGSWCYCP